MWDVGLGKPELEFHGLPLSGTLNKALNATKPQLPPPVTQDLMHTPATDQGQAFWPQFPIMLWCSGA